MKKCTKCNIDKLECEFAKDKYSKSGITSSCKQCRNKKTKESPNRKIKVKEYKLKNKNKIKQSTKEYYANNKEKILKKNKTWYLLNKDRHKELSKNWFKNNKDKIKIYTQKRRDKINNRVMERKKTDPIFKLRVALGARTRAAFKAKSWRKGSNTESMLKCSYEEAKAHIESLFKEGMTWNNYGEWHLDHIIPLASAKSEDELMGLCCITNLQPLSALENILKSDKVNSKRTRRISEATYFGRPMTELELEILNEDSDFVYESVIEQIH